MRITWSLPVPGEPFDSGRGDVVRARSLIQALRALGHEVNVVAAAEEAATSTAVRTYRGVVRRLLPRWAALALRTSGRMALARAHARRVAVQARQQAADLIVETQMHGVPSGTRAARAAGRPLLLDDCSPPEEEIALGTVMAGLTRRAFRHEANGASILTVSSEALARKLVDDGVPREKLAVVPNGVDLAGFSPRHREATRSRLGLDGRLVLGFVGSFQPWHRVDLLLESITLLDPSIPFHLLLVGDGDGRAPALDRAADLGIAGRITAPGALPHSEATAALAACDIGVLPGTNHYGQPMKLTEYGAAGLPAVAPDLPPVREILRDGETGLLFTPGDALGLSDALTRLAKDTRLRARFGHAARVAAEERTWALSAHRMMEAALTICQPGGAS
jgi:glycosyltransferase involved in cell wall biosynthesis